MKSSMHNSVKKSREEKHKNSKDGNMFNECRGTGSSQHVKILFCSARSLLRATRHGTVAWNDLLMNMRPSGSKSNCPSQLVEKPWYLL